MLLRFWCACLSWMACGCLYAQYGHALSVADSASEQSVYYVLGCKHQGWEGYFALDNWYQTISYGDGGVDVTEAPNATVAEGATSAQLKIQTGSSTDITLRITVPADGYLYFKLKKVGSFLSPRGVYSTDTDFYVLINGQREKLKPLPNGSYYSPLLKAGSTFGLSFVQPEHEFLWEDLSYYSNCSGVWVDDVDYQQGWQPAAVRPIERPRLKQIYFSYDRPQEWPMLDMDGDLLTLFDQQRLIDGNLPDDSFDVSYDDEPAIRDDQYWLKRTFKFVEPCSGNRMEVERWWVPLPLIPSGTAR